ncbi:MAG TPA: polysaccharide deacetylase family protein [Gaiellaceae bacterium]|nr:polysaccharide deacetylase family protein [Gaiellaceae bacterium]
MADGRPYRYSALPSRPALRWPDGARLAVYVALNLEYYESGKPALSLFQGTASFSPDPLNEGWRDYGPRVGVWRLVDVLDRLELPVTAPVNSDVCGEYPEIVSTGVERGWAWVAHGKNNSTLQVGMEAEAERSYIADVLDTIEAATGARPRGWLGPALTETPNTLQVLSDLGVDYVLDWAHDDQPARLDLPSGRPVTLPYSSELNDIPAFLLHGMTGADFAEEIVSAFDALYAASESTGLVFTVGLHPFLSGQPQRIGHVARALEYLRGHDGVWLTTADAIADAYLEQV